MTKSNGCLIEEFIQNEYWDENDVKVINGLRDKIVGICHENPRLAKEGICFLVSMSKDDMVKMEGYQWGLGENDIVKKEGYYWVPLNDSIWKTVNKIQDSSWAPCETFSYVNEDGHKIKTSVGIISAVCVQDKVAFVNVTVAFIEHIIDDVL
ncbi:MAG: hypothetical protein K6C05_08295 [Anaerovibrio sp.]|uniref:hypothetical protein n=1 Tax=Anaerovibrio sp. TaxID=1872532 RepID=UPI0025F674BC|nr:hypothetical protein [Anaerovibrio sp.]MCR5176836.1 hypothetical protein [Anaerovibrio sp.]